MFRVKFTICLMLVMTLFATLIANWFGSNFRKQRLAEAWIKNSAKESGDILLGFTGSRLTGCTINEDARFEISQVLEYFPHLANLEVVTVYCEQFPLTVLSDHPKLKKVVLRGRLPNPVEMKALADGNAPLEVVDMNVLDDQTPRSFELVELLASKPTMRVIEVAGDAPPASKSNPNCKYISNPITTIYYGN